MKKTITVTFIIIVCLFQTSILKGQNQNVINNVDSCEYLKSNTVLLPVVIVSEVITYPDSINLILPDFRKSLHSLNTPSVANIDLINYLIKNLVYPNELITDNIQDDFNAQLIIAPDGTLKTVDVLDGNVLEMRNEIIRAIKKLPQVRIVRKDKEENTSIKVIVSVSFKVIKL